MNYYHFEIVFYAAALVYLLGVVWSSFGMLSVGSLLLLAVPAFVCSCVVVFLVIVQADS